MLKQNIFSNNKRNNSNPSLIFEYLSLRLIIICCFFSVQRGCYCESQRSFRGANLKVFYNQQMPKSLQSECRSGAELSNWAEPGAIPARSFIYSFMLEYFRPFNCSVLETNVLHSEMAIVSYVMLWKWTWLLWRAVM